MSDKNEESTEQTEHKLLLRQLQLKDYNEVKAIMETVYRNIDGSWTRKEFSNLLKKFPEGQICIEDKGQVIAVALSLIVDYAVYGDKHTYEQIIDKGTFKSHDPEGDTLYGIDVFVHPEYRNLRLGRRLYDARKEICENLNLRGIIAGGRIPGYRHYADKLTPAKYIEMVRNKELSDSVLSFQLSNGFHVRKIMKNY